MADPFADLVPGEEDPFADLTPIGVKPASPNTGRDASGQMLFPSAFIERKPDPIGDMVFAGSAGAFPGRDVVSPYLPEVTDLASARAAAAKSLPPPAQELPFLEMLQEQSKAGLADMVGGGIRGFGEQLQAPFLALGETALAPLVKPITDVWQPAVDAGTMANELAAAQRAAASVGAIASPESVDDLAAKIMADPEGGARFIAGIGAESLPAILLSMATRNPQAATRLMGLTTGAATYGQQRQDGADPALAMRQAQMSGLLEMGLGQSVFDEALGGVPLARRLVTVPALESGTEAATGVGQSVVGDILAGRTVDSERAMVEGAIGAAAGFPMGVGEAVLGKGPDAKAPVSAPPAAEVRRPEPAPPITPQSIEALLADPEFAAALDALAGTPTPAQAGQAPAAEGGSPEAAGAALPVEPVTATPVALDAPQAAPVSLGDAVEAPKVAIDLDPETGLAELRDAQGGLIGNAIVEDTPDGLQMRGMELAPDSRGKGLGIDAYMQLADTALAQGKPLVSDTEMTPDAMRMYPALERRGYTVERTEINDIPGFRVTAGPKQAKPVAATPATLPAEPAPKVAESQESQAPTFAKMYAQGKNSQAVQLEDGTWRVRTRKNNQWQPWQQRDTFDPSPTFGYREFTPDGGYVNIDGKQVRLAPKQAPRPKPVAGPKKPTTALEALAIKGLNRDAWQREGVDPGQFGKRFGITPLFRKEGGRTPDEVLEFLQENFYLPRESEDKPAGLDNSDAIDVVMRGLSDEDTFADDDSDAVANWRDFNRQQDEEWQQDTEAALADAMPELDDADMEAAVAYAARFAEQEANRNEARDGADTEANERDSQAGEVRGDQAQAEAKPAPKRPTERPAPPVAPEPTGNATSTKNAVAERERAERGEDPIIKALAQTNGETLANAQEALADNPDAGQEIVERLKAEGPSVISVVGEAVMLVEKVRLRNVRDAAAAIVGDENASPEAREAARVRWDEAEARLNDMDQATAASGREWGRLGQFRQRMLRQDFTFEALERRERVRQGRALTADESASLAEYARRVQRLEAKLQETQAALDEATGRSEADAAYKALLDEMKKSMSPFRPSATKLKENAASSLAALRDLVGVNESRNVREVLRQSGGANSGPTDLELQAQDEATVEEGRRAIRAMDALVSPQAQAVRKAMGASGRHVEVLDSRQDLPERLRALVTRDDTEGVFDPETGRVFVFISVGQNGKPMTPARAVWVAFHETSGHLGIRGAVKKLAGGDRNRFGERFVEQMSQAQTNDFVKAVAAEIRSKNLDYSGTRSAEEALSEIAAAVQTGNWDEIATRYKVEIPRSMRGGLRAMVDRFIQGLRRFLQNVMGKDAKFTDGQVLDLLSNAWRYAQTSPVGEAGRGNPLESRLGGSPTFYSAALRAVEQGKGAPKKADATGWKGWLDGAVRRGEMKQSERDWLGLDAWLEGRGATTKDELAGFIRANQVQITPVVLGGEQTLDKEVSAELGEWLEDSGYDPEDLESADDWRGVADALSQKADADPDGEGGFQELYDEAMSHVDNMQSGMTALPTKFSSYQLPGGRNYREGLLTLPTDNDASRRPRLDAITDQMFALVERYGSTDKMEDESLAEYRRLEKKYYDLADKPVPPKFQSSHFPQPNILVHLRTNERTDSQGREVLFIEEIQSDWHQAGRKRGYAGVGRPSNPLAAEAVRSFEESAARGENAGEWRARHPEYAAALRSDDSAITGVPDAPLKSTKDWAMLAFKQAVRDAVERGKSVVAWTTGDQQNARYDLAKSVDMIRVSPNADGSRRVRIHVKNSAERPSFDVGTDGSVEPTSSSADAFRGKALDEVVGKDMAEKIMAAEEKHDFTGVELAIGGEGMRSFYDKILPAAVNDWAKKFGGKVGQVKIATDPKRWEITPPSRTASGQWMVKNSLDPNSKGRQFATEAEARAELDRLTKSTSQHSLEITEAIREAVEGGMPLFSRRAGSGDLFGGPTQRDEVDAERRRRDAERDGRTGTGRTDMASGRGDLFSGPRPEQARIQQNGLRDTHMQAPPGSVSKPILPPRFGESWFHGRQDSGRNFESGRPSFFARSEQDAEWYAQGNGNVTAHRVAAERPARVRDLQESLARLGYESDPQDDGRLRDAIKANSPYDGENLIDAIYIPSVRAELERQGFDSLLVYDVIESGSAEALVVWDSEKISPEQADLDRPLESRRVSDAPDQTKTPEFKAWFGESKVVDSDGKPRVMYHGTKASFDAFDIGKLNSRNEGPGFYFTSNREVASGYGKPMEVFLSVQKPLPLGHKAFKGAKLEQLIAKVAEIEAKANGEDTRGGFLSNFGDTYSSGVQRVIREAAQLLQNEETAVDQISGMVGAGVPAKVVLQAVTDVYGFDGIVADGFGDAGASDWGNNDIVVAFRPNQIKSATGNRGTFDPDVDSILESRVDSTQFFHLSRIGAVPVSEGVTEYGPWLERMKADLGPGIYAAVEGMLPQVFEAAKMQAAGRGSARAIDPENITSRDISDLARKHIADGVRGEDAVMKAVTKDVQALDPEMTERDVRRLLSEYGKVSFPSREQDKVLLREIRALVQLQESIDRLLAGMDALKSGPQRDKATQAIREKRRTLNDLLKLKMKDKAASPETLATYQQTRVRNLQNQIEDLTKQIATGERPVRAKAPAPNAELQLLIAQRDALQAEKDAIDNPRSTRENEAKKRALKKQIEDVQARLAGKRKPTPERPFGPDDAEVTALKTELQAARDALKALERPTLSPDERYQRGQAKSLERQLAAIKERFAANDYARKPRPVPKELNDANQKAKVALMKVKAEFAKRQFEDEMSKRHPVRKIFANTGELLMLTRAYLTSLDWSALGRQGGKISFGHPVRAARGVPSSVKAAMTEEAALAAAEEIAARPNAKLYEKYGLELTKSDTFTLSEMEEKFASRWLESMPNYLAGGLVRASGRGYVATLNRLRADSFDAMVAALSLKKVPTEAEGKAIANYINVATGRGLIGPNNKWGGAGLNIVFFAPRLVASRFNLLTLQPLYGGTARTRLLILQEYSRYMMGVSVVFALAAAYMAAFGDDDDEPLMTMDPRSSNFLKIKFGNTYLDPMSGLSQVTVFAVRMAAGETVTADGELRPLRDAYRLSDFYSDTPLPPVDYGGGNIMGTAANFTRTKFAPIPGQIATIAIGEDYDGEVPTVGSVVYSSVVPISFQDVHGLMTDNGLPTGMGLFTLSLLGMGVQYRKPDPDRKYSSAMRQVDKLKTEMAGRISRMPKDQWQAEFDKLKAEYPGLLAGTELAVYKDTPQNRKAGRAGVPMENSRGELKIQRVASGAITPTDVANISYEVKKIAGLVRDLREDPDLSLLDLQNMAREKKMALTAVMDMNLGAKADLSVPATAEQRQAAIAELESMMAEYKAEAVELVEKAGVKP